MQCTPQSACRYYAEALGRPDIDDVTKLFRRLFDQNISAAYETNLSTGPTRLFDRFKSFNVIKIDINALPRSQLGAFNKLCHRNSRDKRISKLSDAMAQSRLCEA